MERTGGKARVQVCQALHGETPFGVRESTRTSRNRVDFSYAEDAGNVCGFARSGNRGLEGVPVGRSQAKGPGCRTVRAVHRKIPGHREPTEGGGDSRAAPIDQE